MLPDPIKLQIRFRDLDALGHVNNAVYLSYLELCRVHYFNVLVGRDFDYNADGFLLARNEIDYRRPLLLNDEVCCKMWCEKIGNKSFVLAYEIFNDKAVFVEAKSVMVAYNSNKHETQEINPKLRKGLELLMRNLEQ